MPHRIEPLCFGVNCKGVVDQLSVTWPTHPPYTDVPALGVDLVGTSLFDHIAGEATRDLVASLLDAVNVSGKSICLPYRCDTPWTMRMMEMRVFPRAAGGVMIGHRQISEHPLPEHLRFRTVCARESERCSFCNRISCGRAWVDSNKALELGLLSTQDGNFANYGVCIDCERRAQRAMRR